MADKPVTREEKYLAYLTGDYTGEIPKPITRKEQYLYEICLKGMGGEISPEEIKNAVNEYLEKNPVKPGATTEQAQQIEQNKTDIASLKTETGSLKEDILDIKEKFTSTNKGIKPLFLELSADYNWVSNNEVPIFSTSNERFADGTADGNNAYFKINGNKGDNFVTVIEGGNALISDITITGWWGAIISNDGVHYSPCNARYKDGNTIEIYPPLSENITDGELGNIKTGIHLSKRGYSGYAQKAFSLNPKWCEKGKPIAKFRVGDTEKFIKFGGLALLAPNSIENMSNEFLCRYATTFSSLDFYNSWTDHETPTGIEWETELGGKSGYLELFVGGRNASYIEYPDGYENSYRSLHQRSKII